MHQDERQLELDMEDSLPAAPVRRSTDTGHRKLFRFSPDISMGTVLQIVVIMSGAAVGYGTYEHDKAIEQAEVAQLRVDADNQRVLVRENLTDIKTDVKDIQRTLINFGQVLAVLQAQAGVAPINPVPQKGQK